MLGNWNQNVTPGDVLAGDLNGDGFVGIEDLNAVLGNWNAGTPPMDVLTSVPEPAGAVLMLTGIAGLSRRRCRRTA
ncbi:MAG: PEP-CTERM sorting domain-containing protein [Phycisphaerales bacterium]